MRILLIFLTVIVAITSQLAYADNYELAGKIMQADKEVRNYQAAKAGGYGYIYNDTSTGEAVIVGIIVLGLLAFLSFILYFWLSDKFGGSRMAGDDKHPMEFAQSTNRTSAGGYVYVPDYLVPIIDNIKNMTVAQIAAATGKSNRSIMTTLSRHYIVCDDYDGLAKGIEHRDRLKNELDAAKSDEEDAIVILKSSGVRSTVLQDRSEDFSRLKELADRKEASIDQLKQLYELSERPVDRFKYLAFACQRSLSPDSGKGLLKGANLRKLNILYGELDLKDQAEVIAFLEIAKGIPQLLVDLSIEIESRKVKKKTENRPSLTN